jgi:hypothetical protein
MLVLAVKFSEACEFQGIVQQIAYNLLDAYWVGECRDGTISATKLKFNTFLFDRREKGVDSPTANHQALPAGFELIPDLYERSVHCCVNPVGFRPVDRVLG